MRSKILPLVVTAILTALLVAMAYGADSDARKLSTTSGPPGRTAAGVAEETAPQRWHLQRTVTTNDTALTTDTRAWATIGTLASPIPSEWNTISIGFVGYGDGDGAGAPTSGTFTWKVYVCSQYGGAELVANGTGSIGTTQLSHWPETGDALSDGAANSNYCWGDKPVLTQQYWAQTVGVSGETDGVGRINFDRLDEYGLYVEVAGLTSVTTLYVYAKGR